MYWTINEMATIAVLTECTSKYARQEVPTATAVVPFNRLEATEDKRERCEMFGGTTDLMFDQG